MDCSICINKFNKLTRKQVSCPACEAIACRACYVAFLCARADEPCCMFCKQTWSDDVLFERFSKNFVSKTLVACIVENMFKIEVASELGSAEVVAGAELCRTTGLCPSKLKKNLGLHLVETKRKSVRMYPCPGCTGFVSSATMRCVKCDGEMCSECHMSKGDLHACKPEDVETVNALKLDTKPCPKCHIPIYKIEGCDQMWCIECHTTFSWKTLVIETGAIHNPHYNDFMRKRGRAERNPYDIPCGGVPDYFRYHGLEPAHREYFSKMLQNIHEMRGTAYITGSIAYFRKKIQNLAHANTVRRIRYVLGQITEIKYKQDLARHYNTQRRLRALVGHVTSHVIALEDLFRNFDYIYRSPRFSRDSKIDLLVSECMSLDALMKKRLDWIQSTYNTKMCPIRGH